MGIKVYKGSAGTFGAAMSLVIPTTIYYRYRGFAPNKQNWYGSLPLIFPKGQLSFINQNHSLIDHDLARLQTIAKKDSFENIDDQGVSVWQQWEKFSQYLDKLFKIISYILSGGLFLDQHKEKHVCLYCEFYVCGCPKKKVLDLVFDYLDQGLKDLGYKTPTSFVSEDFYQVIEQLQKIILALLESTDNIGQQKKIYTEEFIPWYLTNISALYPGKRVEEKSDLKEKLGLGKSS